MLSAGGLSLSVMDIYPGYSFIRRLKHLSKQVRIWKSSNTDSFKEKKKVITKDIDRIDTLEASGSLDEQTRLLRKSLKADLQEIVLLEARYWSQRCKKLWLNDGDENSAFFHKVCTARRRKNQIHELSTKEGISIVFDNMLEKEVIDHF